MGYFQVDFFSPVLGFQTEINVVVPTPDIDDHWNADQQREGASAEKKKRFPVLYLFHGAYGDHTNWGRLSSIERYATERGLAVVMPAVSNSIYQNMEKGSSYLTYLTEELPEFVTALFPLSRKRENTFAAGLSMGGYGALRVAFEKPEWFAACGSLSGMADLPSAVTDMKRESRDEAFCWDAILGENMQVEGTGADLAFLVWKRREEKRSLPKIFISCGTEDFLYRSNRELKRKLEELGVDFTFEEHPGSHNWDYWDRHITRMLDWLLMEKRPAGAVVSVMQKEESGDGTY